MSVNIYLPHSFETSYTAEVIVGVDYGAYLLAKKGVKMDFAIGDFDSVSESEFKLIKKYSKKIIKLNIEKNETDSEAAIIYLQGLGYSDLTLIGDVGSRLDHVIVNYRLTEKYDVTYILEKSKILNLKKGIHTLKSDYQFLSLFTNNSCELNLSGTKYTLSNTRINYYDTFTSANEIIGDFAQVEVLSGNVTIVLSDDK